MTKPNPGVTEVQLQAQRLACTSMPRKRCPYRVAHIDGRITDHQTFAAAEKTWRFGDVLYLWQQDRWAGRWAIYTSAGWL